MCGIAGLLILDAYGAGHSSLEKMIAAVAHRGPDGAGVWFSPLRNAAGSVGLGHRRLAILDRSPAGHQPMHDPATGNVLVFNGEIYNFRDVRRDLEGQGHIFRSQTDTEVILKAYAHYGVACLQRFRGMFAFALWDAQRQHLFLARDRLGVKPLYYYRTPKSFFFASEVRALLVSGLVPRRLSLAGLDSYLTLGAVQDPLTMIENVSAVPAGYYAIWKDREFTLTPYWTPPTRTDEELAHWSRQKTVGHLRELLEESIRLRLISDVPLGAFLSGGIDSSAIVALMARVSPLPPQTVSVVFPEQEFSEAPYMQRLAQRFGTKHTEVVLTAERFLANLPEALAAMDQPTFDGINTYIVSKYAYQAGLTVALSGIGGDELFAGYNSFVRAPRLERLQKWAPGLVRYALGTFSQRILQDSDRARKLQRWFHNCDLDGGAYLLVRELFSPGSRHHLVPALNDVHLPPRPVPAGLDSLDAINRVSIYELTHYMQNVLLRDTDGMGMAHALEIREPFLDHPIVEFLLKLPGKVKMSSHQPKPLLVEAVGDLPPEVASRHKQGFVLPFSRWLRKQLRENIEAAFHDIKGIGPLGELFDGAAVQSVWQRFLEGKGVWVRPWSLYVLQQWCARHL